ncbi:M61 family metallopeptidase [Aliidiomarina sanyensis]|uniref:Aminopeptidase n=1 Tax=Aliidiomarina sanyensis TaxID=1249555 RepID=A0A432WRR7_9GAMM|nr:PDZ domain-containing protein [Aliidiomarina sanyensis]RUO36465.1 aminopeptidase [Aliidiomarina sanyensis]
MTDSSPRNHPHFTIAMDMLHHYFEVNLSIPAHSASEVTLRLPAWLPGSYMIRDFAKHIVTFSVTGARGALDYRRTDKSTWTIPTEGQAIEVSYRVYALDLSVRTAYLTHEFGFFNPSAICLEWIEESTRPISVSLNGMPHGWQVKTGMPQPNPQIMSYQADDYASLIDYPFLMGQLDIIPFDVQGIPHELVLTQPHYADRSRLATDLQRICAAQIELFTQQNEAVPFQTYSFLTIVVGDGFGGLEHRNSTALLASRHTLEPGPGTEPSDDYLTFLSLCSHEYFHSWNVKQLRPREFHPYQLSAEQYTEQLWFYEGMTSYYDDWMVYRAGAMSRSAFLNRMSQTMTRALRGKGPQRQSIAESSFLAWTTFYQQNENAGNAIASYYSKGAIVALLADLYLRGNTPQSSLDDVMRLAYARYAATGTELENLLQLFGDVGGTALQQMIERAVFTTDPIDLAPLLEPLGLEVLPAVADPFTQQLSVEQSKPTQVTLGATLQEKDAALQVMRVWEDSPAALAGLMPGDRIIALDGIQASRAHVYRHLYRAQSGDTSTLHYFRRDVLFEARIEWQALPADSYRIRITDPDKSIRWLG